MVVVTDLMFKLNRSKYQLKPITTCSSSSGNNNLKKYGNIFWEQKFSQADKIFFLFWHNILSHKTELFDRARRERRFARFPRSLGAKANVLNRTVLLCTKVLETEETLLLFYWSISTSQRIGKAPDHFYESKGPGG